MAEVTRMIQIQVTVVFHDVEPVESAKEQIDFIKNNYMEMFQNADQVLVEVKDFIKDE